MFVVIWVEAVHVRVDVAVRIVVLLGVLRQRSDAGQNLSVGQEWQTCENLQI